MLSGKRNLYNRDVGAGPPNGFLAHRLSEAASVTIAGQTSIAIIGGGIGGLSAAASLLRAGFDVQVYEQTRTLAEVGAGIVALSASAGDCRRTRAGRR
jgi:NADPH-dependent 2,4-dienoyl-CoA reductase/sulfur reductase-like enzyme